MKHLCRLALAAVALLGPLAAGQARAQPFDYPIRPPAYGPFYRPGLSPYLNMLRGGDPAVNYYLGVVPEFQRRRNDAVFRGAILDLEARTAAAPALAAEDVDIARPLAQTGHVTAFNNTANYFNNPIPLTGVGARTIATTPSRSATPSTPSRYGRSGSTGSGR
jgi:hypothetical protein